MDSSTSISYRVGKNKDYFSKMERTRPDHFEYLKKIGDSDLELGYYNYLDERKVVLDTWLNTYSKLEEKRNVSRFSREYEYKAPTISKLGIRLLTRDMTFKTFITLKGMIPKMEEFIEKNTRMIK